MLYGRTEKELIDSITAFVDRCVDELNACDEKDSKKNTDDTDDGKRSDGALSVVEGLIDEIINNGYKYVDRGNLVAALQEWSEKASPEGFKSMVSLLEDKLKNAKNSNKITGYLVKKEIENKFVPRCYITVFYNILTKAVFTLENKAADNREVVRLDEVSTLLTLIFRYGNICERPSNLAVDKLKAFAESCTDRQSFVKTIEDALTAAYVKRDIDKGSLENYCCGSESVIYILKFSKSGHDNTIELTTPSTFTEVPEIVSFDVVKEIQSKFGGTETPDESKLGIDEGVTGTTRRDCCGVESDKGVTAEVNPVSTSGYCRLVDEDPVDTCGAVMTTASTMVNDAPAYEVVDHPAHYNQYPIETIDMMVRIWGNEATARWCEMTAFKYRMRMGHKPDNDTAQDIEKERWYLNKAMELRKVD